MTLSMRIQMTNRGVKYDTSGSYTILLKISRGFQGFLVSVKLRFVA